MALAETSAALSQSPEDSFDSPTQERGVPPIRNEQQIAQDKAKKLARMAVAEAAFADAQAAGAQRATVYRTAYDILHPGESFPKFPAVNILLKDETVIRGVITKFNDHYEGTHLSAMGPSAMIDLNAVVLNNGLELPIADIAVISRGPIDYSTSV